MVFYNGQIGLPTESRDVVNPTKNSPVIPISVYFFNRLLNPDLLINRKEIGKFPKFIKNLESK